MAVTTSTAPPGGDQPRTPSRRALLAGAAALSVMGAASTPTSAAAAHHDADDARLLQVCAKWLADEAVFDRLFELECAAEEVGAKAVAHRYHMAQRALVPPSHEMLEEICDLPAATAAGLRAKAEVSLARVQLNIDGDPLDLEAMMEWSLARDVLRLLPEGRT